VFAVVALFSASLVWIGLHMVNRRVEQAAERRLDAYIAEQGAAQELDYARIETNVALGRIAIRKLRLVREGFSLRAEELLIDVPAREAPGLLRNPAAFTLSEARLRARGLELAHAETESGLEAAKLELLLRGRIGPQLARLPVAELARHLFALEFSARQLDLRAERPGRIFPADGPAAALFGKRRSVPVERISGSAALARASQRVELKETELRSPLLQLSARGAGELDEELRVRRATLRLRVRSIDEALRRRLGEQMGQCGGRLPERGPFRLRIAVGGEEGLRCEFSAAPPGD
jgi:hypothetical protein